MNERWLGGTRADVFGRSFEGALTRGQNRYRGMGVANFVFELLRDAAALTKAALSIQCGNGDIMEVRLKAIRLCVTAFYFYDCLAVSSVWKSGRQGSEQ